MKMFQDKQLVAVRMAELHAEAEAQRLAGRDRQGDRSQRRWSLGRIFRQARRAAASI